jgi:hypothetical protein
MFVDLVCILAQIPIILNNDYDEIT